MAEVASAFVSIMPSARGFGSKLESEVGGEVGSSGKSLGSKFGTALKVGALAVTGGAVLLGGFLKGAIGEAREAQKVGALTNAVIKSTGGVANVTAKDVDRLATSISLKTGVDDEAIASGQNMLLTFGNVRNEVGKGNDIFNQATVAANDMAAAFGGDAVSNSKMLGKALNDPTRGVSALTRVGVSFTQQQKDQIKAMQESGNVLGAQKIILGELTKQTGGAAEAQATAGDKLRVTWDNFRESVGTAVLPIFDKILVGLASFVTFLTNDVGPGIAALNGYLAPAIDAVIAFFSSLSSGTGAAGGLLSTLSSIGASLKASFLPVLQTAATTFQTVVLPAVSALVSYLAGNLIPIFVAIGQVIAGQVVPIVAAFAQFIYGTVYPAVVQIATAIASNLKPVLDQLFATFQAKILPALTQVLAKLREWQPTIQQVIAIVLKVIGVVLVFAAKILGVVLPVLIRFAGFLIGKVVSAVVAVIEIIAKVIGFLIKMGAAVVAAVKFWVDFQAGVLRVIAAVIGAVSGLVGKVLGFLGKLGGFVVDAVQAWVKWQLGIARVAGNVIGFVADIPGKIMGALGNLGSLLYNAGRELIQGLINGITSKIGELTAKMGELAGKVKAFLPGSPVKTGPLKSWNNGGAGKRLVGLLADGLADTAPVDRAMTDLAQRVASPMALDHTSAFRRTVTPRFAQEARFADRERSEATKAMVATLQRVEGHLKQLNESGPTRTGEAVVRGVDRVASAGRRSR